jgi:translocator protein
MTWMEWYDSLAKPAWTPAPATISLIWMVLYPFILVSFGFVFFQAFRRKVPWRVAVPFAVNLVANLLFMPILWCLIVVWPVYKWVAVAQVPYLVWVSIATVLQVSITAMNW